MSFKKEAPSFPLTVITKRHAIYRQKITSEIAAALHREYGRKQPPNKKIARGTATTARAVKNWFSGRNAPDSANLIHLMEHSDAVLSAVLRLANRHDLLSRILEAEPDDVLRSNPKVAPEKGPINESSKGHRKCKSSDSLLRQAWILDQIRAGKSPSISSVVLYWKVSRKQARNDIDALKKSSTIVFVGAKKNGRYVLL